MLPVPEACRESMDYARYLRDYEMQEWGRWTSLGREGLRFAREDTRKVLAHLRALRSAERGMGVKP